MAALCVSKAGGAADGKYVAKPRQFGQRLCVLGEAKLMTRDEALTLIVDSWKAVVGTIQSVPQSAWEITAAVSTAAAAFFAAWSAWTSRSSAKAARDAVDEARLARKEEKAPRLVLERDFLDCEFVWPHPASLNGEPVFLARKHWKDDDPSPPTFSITNYGEGPALELEIVFDLDDPNGELVIPEMFKPLGLSVGEEEATRDALRVKVLEYRLPNGSGGGAPMMCLMAHYRDRCAAKQEWSGSFARGWPRPSPRAKNRVRSRRPPRGPLTHGPESVSPPMRWFSK